MKNPLVELLREQRASLNSCPACPVKGTCVFATPGFEPGYCLHEYRLLHAFMARRLRVHPPAGVQSFDRLRAEAATFVERLRRETPHGSAPHQLPASNAWPNQATLSRFA